MSYFTDLKPPLWPTQNLISWISVGAIECKFGNLLFPTIMVSNRTRTSRRFKMVRRSILDSHFLQSGPLILILQPHLTLLIRQQQHTSQHWRCCVYHFRETHGFDAHHSSYFLSENSDTDSIEVWVKIAKYKMDKTVSLRRILLDYAGNESI